MEKYSRGGERKVDIRRCFGISYDLKSALKVKIQGCWN